MPILGSGSGLKFPRSQVRDQGHPAFFICTAALRIERMLVCNKTVHQRRPEFIAQAAVVFYSEQWAVGVGTMIAHAPLHRSGRAALPHPAPALGHDAEAQRGTGDCRTRLAPDQFRGCFRSFGDYEKAKERRIFEERIFSWGEGGASLRPWTFMLLDSCCLRVTCGAKWGSKRAKRGCVSHLMGALLRAIIYLTE